jgi:outer membrane biosynthesis protein TonB
MKDRSQLDDMRAALRGDLERARERRGGTLLDREPEPLTEPAPEPEPESQDEVSDTPDEASDVVAPVSDTLEPEPEPTPRRRLLWFLHG